MTGFFTVANYKTYGQANGLNDDNYLAFLGSFAAVCNTIRFLWSSALDSFPYKLVYGLLVAIQMLLAFTIAFVSESRGLYAIWVSLILFCEGGHFTLVPNILKIIYGEQATFLYGILFSYTGVSSAIMMLMQGEFISKTVFSYNVFFAVSGGLSVVALLMLRYCFSQKRFGE